MSNPKLTKWFDGNKFVPAHVGWWHTGFEDCYPLKDGKYQSMFNWWWDGSHWKNMPGGDILRYQNRWFRGLAVKP